MRWRFYGCSVFINDFHAYPLRKAKRNKKPTKKHPFGCLNIVLPKRQNFDEILTFLGKFLRGRVLVVRNRARFCQKLKRSQNYAVLIVLVLKKIEHLPAPADKQRIAVKQRLVRGEVDDDVVVALDRKNVDVVFFADIQRHKRASRPT